MYHERVVPCEPLGEYAMPEHLREILADEQEHAIDLATVTDMRVPRMSGPASV